MTVNNDTSSVSSVRDHMFFTSPRGAYVNVLVSPSLTYHGGAESLKTHNS